MFSANDVAQYIFKLLGEMTAMKLQKLLYYSQAWSLVWDDRPLFNEEIEAWVNGPIVPDIYASHRGKYQLSDWQQGNWKNLDAKAKETIEAVLKTYGDKSSHWLSELTHQEEPWKNARKGLAVGERGNNTITHESMAEYYSNL